MLAKVKKRQAFKKIMESTDFLGNSESLSIINKVWELRDMPSEDQRFKDAYGDFRQHMVNNSDWDVDYIFNERLDLFSAGDETFFKFLEALVDPEIRKDANFIIDLVNIINTELSGTGYTLRVLDFFEGLPVYRIQNESGSEAAPVHMQLNAIKFFTTKAENFIYPCFVISPVDWDDFTYKTSLGLEYRADNNDREHIGYFKAMELEMGKKIWDHLPIEFTELPISFCSFSGHEDYYFKLKELFPNNYNSILFALRDAGIFPKISEKFEDTYIFKRSLIRENYDEELWRTIRFRLAGISYEEGFKFRYDFEAPYAETGIDLDFNFVYEKDVDINHRIYVLIGKNGTGKTRILSGIAQELAKDRPDRIGPIKPLFSKVFTLSYSIFDKFEIQQANSAFNYVYCGLKKSRTEHLTEEELRIRFLNAAKLIGEREFTDDWRDILGNFISDDVLNKIFVSKSGTYSFTPQNLSAGFDLLSSGQHILLYVLTEMLAQIRNESLILYDEPETHLHPNAVAELMNSILRLVKRFKSFCIIATHSPLIVQCVQSRNVMVVNREGNDIQLRALERETYGENLTVITEDIFGNRSIDKDYLQLLTSLVKKGFSYVEIVQMLEKENGLPINLNIRLQLKNMLSSL